MAHISVNDLRQGVVFREHGKLYEVLEFSRHKKARGRGIVNVRVRDLETGNVRELTFKSSNSVEELIARKHNLRFVYYDKREDLVVVQGDVQAGLGAKSHRQKIASSIVGQDSLKYLSEGTELVVTEVDDRIVTMELPPTVNLSVTSAPPADKGDTATGGSKPVEVETGAKINVPLFIRAGDVVRVNTRNGQYVGRL